ncbi:tryptophanase leader peptide [Escherichia coli]
MEKYVMNILHICVTAKWLNIDKKLCEPLP